MTTTGLGGMGVDRIGRDSLEVASTPFTRSLSPPTVAAAGGRAIARQLRKTRMCAHHIEGHCHLGADCAFAHDAEELRAAPDLRKTRLCRLFPSGLCKDRCCGFAHGQAELRATSLFYKRTLCKFHQRGRCRNNENCRFAHGLEELRMDEPSSPPPPSPSQSPTPPPTDEVFSESEPMKVSLLLPTTATEAPLSVLSAVLAEQALARMAMLGAVGADPSHHYMDQVRCLQSQISKLSVQVAPSPPALGAEDTLELAASYFGGGKSPSNAAPGGRDGAGVGHSSGGGISAWARLPGA